ncbi:MAG TPA: universal stress protein [Chloroflexota bacterium]|nr:universal stress protein [Chloroflexota bacterium]
MQGSGDLTTAHSFGHMLVALDGSSLAEESLPYVVAMARVYGSRVTLISALTVVNGVYVRQPALTGAAGDGSAVNALPGSEERHEYIAEYLSTVAERLAADGLEVDWQCPEGERSAEVIVHAARRLAADLIVLTSHGRGRSRHGIFGGVAEEVLRTAPCAVLLLKAHGSA